MYSLSLLTLGKQVTKALNTLSASSRGTMLATGWSLLCSVVSVRRSEWEFDAEALALVAVFLCDCYMSERDAVTALFITQWILKTK